MNVQMLMLTAALVLQATLVASLEEERQERRFQDEDNGSNDVEVQFYEMYDHDGSGNKAISSNGADKQQNR